MAKRVLFVCVENSNRSQMAEAFARMHGGQAVEACSAGSAPSGRINPRAVEFMAELGYDLSTHASKSLDEVSGTFDAVVTMGCGDRCPWVPAPARGLEPARPQASGRRRLPACARRDCRARPGTAGVALSMLSRKLLAEFIGTALLLAAVVGSGIMGAMLSPGNAGIALLANAAATAGALYVLIALFAPVSGAHFNPVVTLAMALHGELRARDALAYVLVQVAAAIGGVLLAHAMFGLPLLQPGAHVRSGAAQWLSEGVAAFGLLLTILLGSRQRPQALAGLVASYIFAAYWFTASTSFANPAVTLARSLTQSFAGIRPADVPGFVLAQCLGALLAVPVARWLSPVPQSSG